MMMMMMCRLRFSTTPCIVAFYFKVNCSYSPVTVNSGLALMLALRT